MKQYITKFLKSLAAFFLVFPVVYIVLVATLFDVPLNTCVSILLSPFYYIVSFTIVLTGYGFWEMRRWSWYLFLISQFLLTYENAILVQSYSESHNKLLAFIVSVLLQLVLVYRVSKEVRVPYFFPKIRWWESNPRYKLSAPVSLVLKSGEKLEGSILDVSTVGCFVKLRNDLPEGESLTLHFTLFGFPVECEGTAVWCTQSAVTFPKGIGVKFGPLNKVQKRSLRAIHRRIKKISSLYRKFRYLVNQDEFLKRLEEVEAGARENG